MNTFNDRARNWDKDPLHWNRSTAIANSLLEMIPVTPDMEALEYGAGTGILSFLLSEKFSEITLMDNSEEMVKVMREKVATSQSKNLKPLFWDLVQNDFDSGKFDCIFSQMVLHHLPDVEAILNKWRKMLKPGGYLAIADLFSEDGTFHNADANVHWGFDPEKLSDTLRLTGFKDIKHKTCFVIKRNNGRNYPVFLLIAKI